MPTGHTILIVEDDGAVARMLQQQLQREGYYCECVADGEQALASVRRHPPDLILLDRMLPGLTGDEVVRRLKADPRTRSIPVVMLTGKGEESDELVGLALGADDYVSKPFSFKVLLARIVAHLRRQDTIEHRDEAGEVKSITLDRRSLQVFVNKTAVLLSPTEYKILATLIAAGGRVLGREQLVTIVYGEKAPPEERNIDGEVAGLRRKMGPAAMCIHVVPDDGYAFCPPPRQPAPA
jgi:two-component system phosphate regulon response regulator PhoB